jgi:hypothetical protein
VGKKGAIQTVTSSLAGKPAVGVAVTWTIGVSLARVGIRVGGRGWKGVRVIVGSNPGVPNSGFSIGKTGPVPVHAVENRVTSSNTARIIGAHREGVRKDLILRKSLSVQ